MALASVTLEGFDQVQLRLELMSRALRKNIIRGGVRATLAVFRSGVRGRTPRKTGTLWRSIGTSTRVLAGGAEVDGKVRIGNRVRGGGRRGATGAARSTATCSKAAPSPTRSAPRPPRPCALAGAS